MKTFKLLDLFCGAGGAGEREPAGADVAVSGGRDAGGAACRGR